MGLGPLGRPDHLLHGHVGTTVGDVVADGGGKQEGILKHHADVAPQKLKIVFRDRPAVHEDLPLRGIVKAGNQSDERRLSRSRRPDEPDHLPRRRIEGNLPEGPFPVRGIPVGNLHKPDMAPDALRNHRLRRALDLLGRIQDFQNPLPRRLGLGVGVDDEPQMHQRADDIPDQAEKGDQLPQQQLPPDHQPSPVGEQHHHADVSDQLHQGKIGAPDAGRLQVGLHVPAVSILKPGNLQVLPGQGLHRVHAADVFLHLGGEMRKGPANPQKGGMHFPVEPIRR